MGKKSDSENLPKKLSRKAWLDMVHHAMSINAKTRTITLKFEDNEEFGLFCLEFYGYKKTRELLKNVPNP